MSEAEKKWADWDWELRENHGHVAIASQSGREAYKAALRREIDNYQEKYGDNQGPIDYTLAKILELLDTVEP